MTEQAAPAAAPAAPSAPPPVVHAGNNFQDFQAQIQSRLSAQPPAAAPAKAAAPAPVAPAVPPPAAPAPAEPATEQPPVTDPNADPNAPAPELDPNAPPAEAATGQITPEDLELLAKAKAWLAGEEVPEEFLKKLVKLENGEEVEYEPYDEVRKGRMRQRDYTRAMQQHLREKEEWTAAKTAYEGHFAAIFNDENDGAAGGEAMYEIYTRQGKRKQLLALGTRLAREEQQIIDGANGVGYAIMHRLGLKDPNDYRVQSAVKREYARRHAELEREAQTRAMQFENERLRKDVTARAEQTQNDEYFAGQRKSLEQLRPRAFEALGLDHNDATHRLEFNRYLDATIRTENAKKVTPELVMKAARAAREEIELQRRRSGGAGKQPAKPAGFQPRLGVGGGAPAGSQPQQWHAENFAEKYKLPRW
jgi:hypothetical protein